LSNLGCNEFTLREGPSSLCNLCVSVVDEFQAKTHHRDAENTEVAQRNQYVATFVQSSLRS